ncbi:unnamed protein product [Calypogeia fissa]
MDSLSSSSATTVPAPEDGSQNYNNIDTLSRKGFKGSNRHGDGHNNSSRNSGSSNQRWIASSETSRSSSSSAAGARSNNKAQDEFTKESGKAVESSSSVTMKNYAAPSKPESGVSTGVSSSSGSGSSNNSSGNNSRASGKVQNSDRRPNNDDNRINVLKDTASLRGKVGNAIHNSRGDRREDHAGAAEMASSFVPYLPQDDAVVAGLGEQEGGVDASETQEVTDLLNEQLSALLRLPPRQFWRKVATDESVSVFLDSYLHFRRRWFDNPLGKPNVSVVAGDGDLSRRVFMVLLRMSSNHDPGTLVSESLSAKEHAAILLEKKLLDIPKLMDISAIYGYDNPDLTKRLVSNVFKVQPGYTGELVAYIPPLLERIYTMHQRCCKAIKAITNPSDKGTTAVGSNALHGELLEVVDFLNDVMITLKAFVKAYPPAADVFVSSGNSISGQGLFLPTLATVHDTLLPILQKGFAALHSPAKDHRLDSAEIHLNQNGAEVAAQDRLRKLSARLVELVWKLLELHYLEGTSGEDSASGAGSSRTYEDAVWKGDSLVQAVVSLGPSDGDDESPGGDVSSSVTRLVCTGALLRSVDSVHGLSFHILQACDRGTVVLDDAQQDYLSALLADTKPSNREKEDSLAMSAESFPLLLTLPEKEVEEETVIQQSKISQIKDLFPEYGNGFIAACLEVYDNDPEKVIERVLEGTLHSDLLLLDKSLTTKPDKVAHPVKDKGKGKVSEETLSSKKKSIWEEKSVMKESGSSSSLAANSGASSGYSEMTTSEVPTGRSVSNLGRYVRRQKDDGNFSELLDNRNETTSAAIRAAAAQIEYEDEYDDSFDDLGGYVADAGGNEETETLADQVVNRGRAQDESVGRFNSGRPTPVLPWGSTPAKGRGNSLGTQRVSSQSQRSAAVVPVGDSQFYDTLTKGRGNSMGAQRPSSDPQRSGSVVLEVDGQKQDTATDPAAGQGRGNRGGKGRKKWKEQGPKPEFYLKDGKLYSYKVAGAVGVSSVEEAEAIKQEETQTIYGLGAGGNVPATQQDTSSTGRKTDDGENSKAGKGGSPGDYGQPHSGHSGEGGRGRGASGRGRGAQGRGSHGRRDDNHHRKDQASKKHFGGLGGF